jgi:hypothetical protein
VSDKHHKKAAFGPSGGGRIYTRDSNPPPMPEERVTTGSEPAEGTVSEFRQPTWREVLEELAYFSGQPEVWRIAELAKRARAALGVEPGHDEQTEELVTQLRREREFQSEELRAARTDERERAVAAVVEEVRNTPSEWVRRVGLSGLAHQLEERFKPSAPGGDDGH